MKALKLSAVIFTALLALSACKTAPGGSSADAKAQEGLNDALGQIGDVAGMDGYRNTFLGDTGTGIMGTRAREVYFDSGFTKFSFIESSVYNGTGDIGMGGNSTFDNDIVGKEATKGELTELADFNTYQFHVQGGSNIDKTGLSGYKIYTLPNVTAQSWSSSKAGGNDAWEEGSNASLDQSNSAVYIKKDGNKLIFMIVDIYPVAGGNPTPYIQFNFEDDPRNPSAENTYTKK